MIKQCLACGGVKEIMKMGCIYGTCDYCNGSGLGPEEIDLEPAKLLTPISSTTVSEKTQDESTYSVDSTKEIQEPIAEEPLDEVEIKEVKSTTEKGFLRGKKKK